MSPALLLSLSGLFRADELSALFLTLTGVVASAVLLASPARELSPRTVASVLLSVVAAAGAFCADDLFVFAAAWLLGLFAIWLGLPTSAAHARLRAAYRVYAALGTLPLLLALVILFAAHDTSFTPTADSVHALSPRAQHLVFALLALAAAFRSGLLPLHSWLPALTGSAPVASSALIFGAQLGPVLVARAIVPLTPAVAQGDLSTFSTWAVASALYAALLGLAQTRVKRTLGFVLTSQSALLLFGISSADPETTQGALLGVLSLGLTSTGLLLLAAALEERAAGDEISRLRGQGRSFPRMTGLFFLLAAAAIGLPGTLPYISEDLLIHGLLRSNPKGAVALLLVTVLNGITLLRLFFALFQGPPFEYRAERKVERRGDLTRREGFVVASLLLVMLITGFAPHILLSMQAHVSERFARDLGTLAQQH